MFTAIFYFHIYNFACTLITQNVPEVKPVSITIYEKEPLINVCVESTFYTVSVVYIVLLHIVRSIKWNSVFTNDSTLNKYISLLLFFCYY